MTLVNADREYAIEEAVQKVEGGLPIRSAARDCGIPESTLRGRLSGAQPLRLAKETEQKLAPVQEELLKKWILNEEATGRAPTRRQVHDFAEVILSQASETEPVRIN
ncbi:hypothetical protein HIM_10670 [Hirsutella minnesotensis 3608]|uniref:Uncharacterized protein n=1 Tax=Hirsutella minnesotensis 3608 TaxID=1043627 RepID=A0A0F7ZX18_9HYPO|nr:hypothetical protein HIM_10670 [Hirsutella minnesotensis 3608]